MSLLSDDLEELVLVFEREIKYGSTRGTIRAVVEKSRELDNESAWRWCMKAESEKARADRLEKRIEDLEAEVAKASDLPELADEDAWVEYAFGLRERANTSPAEDCADLVRAVLGSVRAALIDRSEVRAPDGKYFYSAGESIAIDDAVKTVLPAVTPPTPDAVDLRTARHEEECKKHLDAVARALHPHWPEDSSNTYAPEQLPAMVDLLRTLLAEQTTRADALARDLAGENEAHAATMRQLAEQTKRAEEAERLAEQTKRAAPVTPKILITQTTPADLIEENTRLRSELSEMDQHRGSERCRAISAEQEVSDLRQALDNIAVKLGDIARDRDAEKARAERLEKAMEKATCELSQISFNVTPLNGEHRIQQQVDHCLEGLRRAIEAPATEPDETPYRPFTINAEGRSSCCGQRHVGVKGHAPWCDNSRTSAAARARAETPATEPLTPIPMFLTCPKCSARHIDEGDRRSYPPLVSRSYRVSRTR